MQTHLVLSCTVDRVIYVTWCIVDDTIITITVFYNHCSINVTLPKTFSKNWNIPWFKYWIAHDSQTEILYGLRVCSWCLIMTIYASDRCLQISILSNYWTFPTYTVLLSFSYLVLYYQLSFTQCRYSNLEGHSGKNRNKAHPMCIIFGMDWI